ncbi:hypothetical protein GCM10011428_63560 [Streptomyces violaceus]|nr:hypothetical protein GCM10010270_31130 [Streptomyces janthinus]
MSACQRSSPSPAGPVLFTSYSWGTGSSEWISARGPDRVWGSRRYRAPASSSDAASRSAISRNGPSTATRSGYDPRCTTRP